MPLLHRLNFVDVDLRLAGVDDDVSHRGVIDLGGRRIIHVLEKHEHQNGPGVRLVVLTEEAE